MFFRIFFGLTLPLGYCIESGRSTGSYCLRTHTCEALTISILEAFLKKYDELMSGWEKFNSVMKS